MSAWQPIETGPADRYVLLFVPCVIGTGFVFQGCWFEDSGEFGWIDLHGDVQPATHWMPLPEAPKD